jgi:hypothetical protein
MNIFVKQRATLQKKLGRCYFFIYPTKPSSAAEAKEKAGSEGI